MLDFKSELAKFSLNSDNAIVIGSGILNALGLRESQDIDLVVTQAKYQESFSDDRFRVEKHYGRDILCADKIEMGTDWQVLGKVLNFNDLYKYSVLINGVRYTTLKFILAVKQFGLDHGRIRQKDNPDIKLIKTYFKQLQ